MSPEPSALASLRAAGEREGRALTAAAASSPAAEEGVEPSAVRGRWARDVDPAASAAEDADAGPGCSAQAARRAALAALPPWGNPVSAGQFVGVAAASLSTALVGGGAVGGASRHRDTAPADDGTAPASASSSYAAPASSSRSASGPGRTATARESAARAEPTGRRAQRSALPKWVRRFRFGEVTSAGDGALSLRPYSGGMAAQPRHARAGVAASWADDEAASSAASAPGEGGAGAEPEGGLGGGSVLTGWEAAWLERHVQRGCLRVWGEDGAELGRDALLGALSGSAGTAQCRAWLAGRGCVARCGGDCGADLLAYGREPGFEHASAAVLVDEGDTSTRQAIAALRAAVPSRREVWVFRPGEGGGKASEVAAVSLEALLRE